MAKKDYTNWDRNDLINEIKQLRKRKKYGLVWEDKPEDVVEQCKNELPILEEVKDKEIYTDPDKPTNLLIEGDNYHALSVLNYTHKGKIDVIYIDPPYNTGSQDWKYNNKYVDDQDAFRHSKWLSMMSHRLKIAKNLLKRDGVLIVTIDDNEACTLGLLLDEIFPDKTRATVVIQYNPAGTARSGFSRKHEYAYFLLDPGQEIEKKPAESDVRDQNLRRHGSGALRHESPTMFYPIRVDKATLKIVGAGNVPGDDYHPAKQTIEKKNYFEVWPIDNNDIEKRWYYGRDRVDTHGSEELTAKWVKGRLHVYFHTDNKSEQKYSSVWVGSEYDSGAHGGRLVQDMIGNYFPFPKSIHAVKDSLKAIVSTRKDALILDFFAGSGTTGHAVLELNKEDNGNRAFILCTNNESGIAEEICYPRTKSAILGYEKNGEKIDGFVSNLKYYKTAFVLADPTDKNKVALTRKATEMLCVKENTFDEVKSTDKYQIFRNKNKHTAIIFDHLAITEFKDEIKDIDGRFSVYVFSLGDDTFDEEFEDIRDKVKLSPIPEAILRVYRRIFK